MADTDMVIVHSLLYTIIFGFSVDITMNKIIYNKYRKDNIKTHANNVFFLIVLIFITKAIQVIFEVNYADDKVFKRVSWAVYISFVIQVLFGFKLYVNIRAFDRFRNISLIKNAHRLNALFIIFGGKIALSRIFNYYSDKMDHTQYFIMVTTYITLLLFIYLYYLFRCRRFSKKEYTKIRIQNKNTTLNDMKSYIRGSDFGQDSSIVSEESQNFSVVRKTDNDLYLQYKWVCFEGKLYNLKGFEHPGGNFMLRGVYKKDVTKLIYGNEVAVVYNKSKQRYMVIDYKHDVRTLNFFDENFICLREQDTVIVNRFTDQSFNNSQLSNVNLFDSSNEHRVSINSHYVDDLSSVRWSIDLIDLHDQSRLSFLKFKDINPNECDKTKINLAVYWIKQLGKYYSVCSDSGVKRFFYSVLSLNPLYIKLKRDFLKTVYYDIYQDELRLSFGLEKRLEISSFQFNKGQSDSLADEMVFIGKEEELNIQGDFSIQGPFGNNLGFNSTSSQNYLIIIKDSGIIPFLDLFEIIFQQNLLETQTNISYNWIFGNEYRYCFKNGIKLNIYWEISSEFESTAKIIGLYQLQVLHNFKYNYKIENDIIKDFYVKAGGIDSDLYSCVSFLDCNFDFNFNTIFDHCPFNPRNIIISGDKQFKTRIIEGIGNTANNLLNFTML